LELKTKKEKKMYLKTTINRKKTIKFIIINSFLVV